MAKASKGQAFKESVSDTALAFAINVPLGFLIIEFANWIGIVSTTQTENIQTPKRSVEYYYYIIKLFFPMVGTIKEIKH